MDSNETKILALLSARSLVARELVARILAGVDRLAETDSASYPEIGSLDHVNAKLYELATFLGENKKG